MADEVTINFCHLCGDRVSNSDKKAARANTATGTTAKKFPCVHQLLPPKMKRDKLSLNIIER